MSPPISDSSSSKHLLGDSDDFDRMSVDSGHSYQTAMTSSSPDSPSSAMDKARGEMEPNPKTGFKNIVSSLKRAATSDIKKGEAAGKKTKVVLLEPPETLPDPLPLDPQVLEGVLNTHLSALDRLRKVVMTRNEELQDFYSRAGTVHRQEPHLSNSIRHFDETIDCLYQQRNALSVFVYFHLDEITRIAEHRKGIDNAHGLECTVYERYLSYRRDVEWLQLFSL